MVKDKKTIKKKSVKKKSVKKKTVKKLPVKKGVKNTEPVVVQKKPGYFERLRSSIYKNRYRVTGAVLATVAVGGTAYHLNKLNENNKKLNQQTHQLKNEKAVLETRIKEINIPIDLNINTLQKFFKDSQSQLESMNREKQMLYEKYRKNVDEFINKQSELKELEARLTTANEQDKLKIRQNIDGLKTLLEDLEKRNGELEQRLNEKELIYEERLSKYESKLKRASDIVRDSKRSNVEKNQQLAEFQKELNELEQEITRNQKEKEERENAIKKLEARYRFKIAGKGVIKKNIIKSFNDKIEEQLKQIQTLRVQSQTSIDELKLVYETLHDSTSRLTESIQKLENLKKQFTENEQKLIANKDKELSAKEKEFLDLQRVVYDLEQTHALQLQQIEKQEGVIHKLQTDITDRTINRLIEEYKKTKSDYEKENFQLSAKRIQDKLQQEAIQKTITRNYEAIKNIEDILLKLEQENEKIEQQKRELDQLKRKNLVASGRSKLFSELDRKRLLKQQFQGTVELAHGQFKKEQLEQQKREREQQELQESINKEKLQEVEKSLGQLKSVDPKPVYLTELITLCKNNPSVPQLVINSKDIYDHLSLYNDKLISTDLTHLFSKVKGFVIADVNKCTKDATTVGKGGLITKFNEEYGHLQNVNLEVPLQDLKEKISSLLNSFIRLKDEIYPVRIIVNLAKIKPANSPITSQTIADQNFKNSQSGGKKVHNILEGTHLNKIPDTDYSLTRADYGPFYDVRNTSENTYDVNQDVIRMFKRDPSDKKLPHIIYSAYGFSGSGKSYTLIQTRNRDNILSRVIASIKQLSDDKNIKLRYSIYDYYGETPDPQGCNVLTKTDPVSGVVQILEQDKSVIAEQTTFAEKVVIPLKDYQQIVKGIQDFEVERQTDKQIDITSRTKYHIRYTPNNDQSSRSHLFVDIDILEDGKVIGRITIIDMAGSEDVNTIQQSYFLSIPTQYSSEEFLKSLEAIPAKISYANTQLANLRASLNGVSINDPVTGKPINVIKRALNNIKAISQISEFKLTSGIGFFIKKDAWSKLFKHLKKSQDVNVQRFLTNYNFYNYYIFIVQPIIAFKDKLIEIFKTSPFSLTQVCSSKCVDLSELNGFFNFVGINPIPYGFIDLKQLMDQVTTNSSKPANFDKNKVSLFNLVAQTIKEELFNLTQVILMSGKGKFGELIALNKDSLTQYQKTMLLANKVTIGPDEKTPLQLKQILDKWNREYLYKFHASLRYQGNFIVNSLNQMRDYISCLQNNRILDTKFPGNILHSPSRKLAGSRPKFILFTNIRLDFSLDPKNVVPGSETQNNNIREAYIRSLHFANEINPLTGTMNQCAEGGITLFGKKVKKVKKVKKSKEKHLKRLKRHLRLIKKVK